MTRVVLFDVDNTLFDTEQFRSALTAAIVDTVGPAGAAAFWRAYEEVRADVGAADLQAALSRLAEELPSAESAVTAAIATIRFEDYVLPGAAAALAAAAAIGLPVIVSDGDPVFQRLKIERSGLAAAVGGRVRIYRQKEAHIAEVVAAFPASRYWMVDDKRHILSAYKREVGPRLLTIHVAYGRHAQTAPRPEEIAPDFTVPSIRDVAALLA
ncbi:MAG: haloacid dehalogenase-like hydrolase [Chloroflexota bacterium]|nr:haloacid dehalogenase-like hydrolase [Dehalococcoidia bacterium]MDW8254134.1 haloacid dehalogenase-like hydrolase [Chloroflexota bacterium]